MTLGDRRYSDRGTGQVDPTLPKDSRIDSTAALLNRPYDYVHETCDRLGSDLFETRLLMRPTICMRGAEAAQLFYDEARFKRAGAMPEPVRATLLGKGGVQGLDDQAHRQRKAMFMSLMSEERVADLAHLVERKWLQEVKRWSSMQQVQLYGALHPILMRSVCAWAGVPLAGEDVKQRTDDIVALFDKAAALGLGHLRARFARARSERWLAGQIGAVRSGAIAAPPESALAVIAAYRDAAGHLLASRVAAVELLNVLRPTVAVSVYMVFVAHALHSFPSEQPQSGEEAAADRYVQEVRRFYPFFPAILARVRREFSWNGIAFPKGRRALLDLHATNHSRAWLDPEVFRPARFWQDDDDSFTLVPQGGGDHFRHHRCPGERITLALMKVALRILTDCVTYELPNQDLRLDRGRLPALPRSRFVLAGVQQTQARID